MGKYLTPERNPGDPNRGRVTAGKDNIFLCACILRLDGMKGGVLKEKTAILRRLLPSSPSPPRCCYLAPASRRQGRGGAREGWLTM